MTTSTSATTLYVDLDGTLIRTDLLFESFARLLRASPIRALIAVLYLLAGRAAFKRKLATSVRIEASGLPYQEEFLRLLTAERNKGRRLVLATASDERFAAEIGAYLGIFDRVLGSNGKVNLKGKRKLEAIVRDAQGKPFAYAGNSSADLPIWKAASECIVVDAPRAVVSQLRAFAPSCSVIGGSKPLVPALLKTMRPHQWVKNLLVFVPVITAHKLSDQWRLTDAALAFVVFSLTASAVYVINDLVDLEADRHHPLKRRRPLASGVLPLSAGMLLVPLLLATATALAFTLPAAFGSVLGLYFAITLAYSLYLKQRILIDILLLASLYTIRIFAGGMAAQVPVSEWLMAFSMFLFLSLACVKRYSELYLLKKANKMESKGRGYVADDLDQIGRFGSASAYSAVLVLALYVSSEEVRSLYAHPMMLWFICPIFLYWLSRIWLLAHRGQVDDDPIVFALKDPASYVVGILLAAVMLAAI